MLKKIEFTLKVSLQETPSTIFISITHVKNFEFTLKVSL